jgi:hypothetical protein
MSALDLSGCSFNVVVVVAKKHKNMNSAKEELSVNVDKYPRFWCKT